ncbi:MAG: hypothetical protein QOF33_3599, partial [Thermomicrobiales bacterium]|nr:hypothetical protein [Thermomicrobiales bacterium]
MSTRIHCLGVAGHEITWASKRLLIDPFLSESLAVPVQLGERATIDF